MGHMRRSRREGRTHLWGATALGVLAIFMLGGCATQAAAPQASPTPIPSSKQPISPSTPEASPTNVVIVGTPGVYGPPCQANQLSLAIEQDGVAMGNVGEWGKLTNHSTAACSLFGFPSVQPLDAQRRPMTVQVHQQTSAYLYSIPEQRTQLASGASAYFIIEFTDVPSGNATSCPVSSYLAVTPPNDSGALTIAAQVDDCDGNLYVSPVEPNQQSFAGA